MGGYAGIQDNVEQRTSTLSARSYLHLQLSFCIRYSFLMESKE